MSSNPPPSTPVLTPRPVNQFFGSTYPATGTFTYGSPSQTPLSPFNHRSPLITSPLAPKRGRKRVGDENLPCLPINPTPKRRKVLTVIEKLNLFFDFLSEIGWTYGELIYYASGGSDERDAGSKVKIEKPVNGRHVSVIQHFYHGRSKYGIGHILDIWLRHPYGSSEHDTYSINTSYTTIKPARPALTSFALQHIQRKLIRESEAAVKLSNGLHVPVSAAEAAKSKQKKLEWPDIGDATVDRVQGIIKKLQPLTWQLVVSIAARPPRKREGVVAVRSRRPVEGIATNVISTLNYSRSHYANLLPLAVGLLYFGSSASYDLFRYHTRLGGMPSYGTVIRAMRTLSEHEAEITLAHGRSHDTVGVVRLDNVQNYLIQRDPGIGRANKLNIGLAATYYEVEGVDVDAFNLASKQESLAQRKRLHLQADDFVNLINSAHLETVMSLQWLQILVGHIPELTHLKSHVSMLYRTRAAVQRVPTTTTKAHPLASSSRNETINTELKEALRDFLNQAGQTRDNFNRRVFPFGGDGLTYNKMIELKQYLQFHENEIDSLEILEPMLEWWHTLWTDLSRMHGAHWGTELGDDPSSLGHSAAKLGRKKPTNLGKVDYYPSAQLAYLVLDVRVLDCWRLWFKVDNIFAHFTDLSKSNSLPTIEDLEKAALALCRSYTSHRAQSRAMEGEHSNSTTSGDTCVPLGSAWNDPRPQPPPDPKKKTKPDPLPPFKGDQVLAKSMTFMREAMLSREATYALADGDVGRLYEVIKYMLFTFAGSSHSNYMNYLLETITNLEFESTPELRKALLHLSIVNLTGREGAWAAGDFIQEYFNRILEAVVHRKGVEYGDDFIRNHWARNLHHIVRLKQDFLVGVGLEKRSSAHSGAHTSAEIRILMETYKDHQLHSCRPGRILDTFEHEDEFSLGYDKLDAGTLQKWIQRTTRSRGLMKGVLVEEKKADDTSNLIGEDSETTNPSNNLNNTLGLVQVIDGELQLWPIDIDSEATKAIELAERERAMAEEVEESDESDVGDQSGEEN